MSSIKVTEDIGYFAGYLRLIEESDKLRELYDAFGRLRIAVGDEANASGVDLTARREDPELGLTGRVRSPDIPVLPETGSPEILVIKAKSQLPPLQPPDVDDADLSKTLPPGGFGGGVGSAEPEFSVAYFEGGDDRIVEVEQTNFLNDSDFASDPSAGEPIPHSIDIIETLNGMLGAAEAAAEQFSIPDDGAQAIVDFVSARDAEKAAEPPEKPEIDAGTYVNGVLVDQPPELPTPEPEEEALAIQGHLHPGLDAQLGGNSATNAALIADFNEATTSMVVLGDYFASNAIVQTNILSDNDQVEIGSEAAVSEVGTESSEPINVANFVTTEVNFDDWGHSWTWRVEMVAGDLYDVKVLEQTNVMFDNDTITHTSANSYSAIVTGENDQHNVAEVFDFKKHDYDLIVVTGNYYSVNWIFQTNILLDDDIVKVFGGEDTASLAVSTGENVLTNEATIEHIGSKKFKPLSENSDIDSLVNAIDTKSINPAFAWDMDAIGRVFDVLYVKGSYYDINVIRQTNVMSDADTAVQYLPGHENGDSPAAIPPWKGDETAFESKASSGGNNIKNIAKIVDVGAFANQYLGGDFYEETILVQTNIIEDEDSKNHVSHNDQNIFRGDTKTLVSEVIAFTGPESGDVSEDSQPVKAHHGHHDDMLGNVLS
jgi:hypothetical protein